MRQVLFILVIALTLGAVGYCDFKICTAPGSQRGPAIHGNIVVWGDERDNVSPSIYGADYQINQEFRVGGSWSSGPDEGPNIYNGIVVTYDRVTNLNSNEVIFFSQLDPLADVDGNPVIYENTIVWRDRRNGSDIYGLDLSSGQEFAICTAKNDQESPAIHGDIVVWVDYRESYRRGDIYGYNITTGQEFPICIQESSQSAPAIYGDIVVWKDDRNGNADIYGYNVTTGKEFPICTESHTQYYPAIWKNIIVWQDGRNGGLAWDIYGYNLLTGDEFCLCNVVGYQIKPDIYEDIVVWEDGRNGYLHTDIYGYDLKETGEPGNAGEICIGQVIQGSSANHTGSDMTVLGYNDNVDVWYYFTPAETGHYTVSLCGSGFDTTLAVFDENMIEVAYNEDFCGEQSKLVLKGKAGKRYYIRIAGYDGASGDYVLSIIKDGPEPLQSDINYDGKVNLTDFRIMANEWLKP